MTDRVFNWDEWNDEAEESLNHWNNKYDRGECVEDCVPETTGSSGTSGVPEEPEVFHCPSIESVIFTKCSTVKVFIK